MNTLKFKTNINCNNCLAKVTPVMNKLEGINQWHVDLASPQKTLTVESDQLNAEAILNALSSVGFIGEALD